VIAARREGAVRDTDALAAIELGARRIDAIGAKFQIADDIERTYTRVYAMMRDTAQARNVRWFDLADVTGVNGRLQDLRDLYGETRDMYETAWRRENRPYWLSNVLARYDAATQLWIQRIDQMNDVRSAWARNHTIPPGDSLGIPAPVTPTPASKTIP
jgi:hexosaminidase